MIFDQPMPPLPDPPWLDLPHSSTCRKASRPHERTHCYSELELEDRVVEHLRTRYPHLTVSRQPTWNGIGRPDIVATVDLPWFTVLTVIELKVVPVGYRQWNQLNRYADGARTWARSRPEPYVINAIMGAFYLKHDLPSRPPWLAYWPMGVE